MVKLLDGCAQCRVHFNLLPTAHPGGRVGKAKSSADFRDFFGRRWLIVLLRAALLVGLVGTGAILIAGLPFAGQTPFVTLLVSGLAMMAIDLWVAPARFSEVAGLAILLKLALLLCLAYATSARMLIFWGVLVFSAIIAHAPASVRHRRIFGVRQE
jgi:hypothetical protein